jgi:hypothetical protein
MNIDDDQFSARFGVALKERAAKVVAPSTLDVLAHERVTHRRRRRTVANLSMTVAAAGLLVVALLVTIRSRNTIAPADSAPVTSGSGWFIPGSAAGSRIFFSQVLESGLSYSEKYRVLLATRSADGVLDHPITAQFGEINRIWIRNEGVEQITRREIEVAGVQGEAVRDSVNGTLIIQYQIDETRAIVLTSAHESVSTEQSMLDIAAAIRISGPRSLSIEGELPAGYEVVQASDMTRWFGAAAHISLVGDGSNTKLVEIESQMSPPPGYEFFQMMDTLKPVVVRGLDGWYTTSRTVDLSQRPMTQTTNSKVFWRTPAGQVVTVSGWGVDAGTTLAIANQLRQVDQPEWLAFAATAETVGPGVLDQDLPRLTIRSAPEGYRLDFAKADSDDSGDVNREAVYGVARYVSLDPINTAVLDIRLIRESPEAWQARLDTVLADRRTWDANGRTLVNTGIEPAAVDGVTSARRSVAYQWVKGVVVEFEAYTTDGSVLGTRFGFDELAALAHTVNQYPEVFTDGPVDS